MRVAIMQPTFLPWLGYLNMMASVDLFVFLDNVQISPKSFMTRNRIPGPNNSFLWLNLHEEKSKTLGDRFLNTTGLLKPEEDYNSISRVIKSRYSQSRDQEELLKNLEINISDSKNISDLNIKMILFLCEKFNIIVRTIRASELNVTGAKSEGVLNILNAVGWSDYLVAPGSVTYMTEDSSWLSHEKHLEVYQYEPMPYEHSKKEIFIPYMSSIDALLSEGARGAIQTMKKGSRESIKWHKYIASDKS